MAPDNFPLKYTGLPLIPAEIPPLFSILSPLNLTNIYGEKESESRIISITSTSNSSISTPEKTVFPIPFIPE